MAGAVESSETTGPREAGVQKRPSIAIIDDHDLLSASLRAALQADGFPVIAPQVTDLDQIAELLAAQPPDVALLDLDLGSSGSGERLLPDLVALGTRVLIVSGTSDESTIGRCLQADAWGFVHKGSPFEKLLGAILLAVDGQPVIDDMERDRLLRAWRERRDAEADVKAPFERLSRREAEVLAMLQDGKPVERIARESYVSQATVRTQVRAILTKLDVNSQLEAVAKAAQAGWQLPY